MSIQSILRRTGPRLHASLYRLTKGRVGGRIGKGETILLTTIGRRSGQPRTTPLIGVPDGERVVVIASAAGADQDPDWFRNLVANPNVEVERKGERRPMVASVVEGPDRERLWKAAAALYKGYDRYTQKTSRRIPVVALTPTSSPPPT